MPMAILDTINPLYYESKTRQVCDRLHKMQDAYKCSAGLHTNLSIPIDTLYNSSMDPSLT